MLNSLDLLVIVFMGLVAAGLLGLCLMFLVRNPRIKKICLIATSALALYTGYIGIRIGGDVDGVSLEQLPAQSPQCINTREIVVYGS